MVDKVRELALKILYKMDKDNSYSNILLNEMINKYELYYPNSNIKQRIRNKSKVIKNQRLKRIAEQKDISK